MDNELLKNNIPEKYYKEIKDIYQDEAGIWVVLNKRFDNHGQEVKFCLSTYNSNQIERSTANQRQKIGSFTQITFLSST